MKVKVIVSRGDYSGDRAYFDSIPEAKAFVQGAVRFGNSLNHPLAESEFDLFEITDSHYQAEMLMLAEQKKVRDSFFAGRDKRKQHG